MLASKKNFGLVVLMAFKEQNLGVFGFFKFFFVLIIFAAIFLFVFFNPQYARWYYVLVASIGLYIAVFYVLTNRLESAVFPPALKKFPTVTVLIPSYNGGATLQRCLESVLSFNYSRSFEVIVIDDASTDNTSEILKSFPQVKVIRHQKNLGKAKGLNKAIGKIKSELVVCVDSDTYPNPNVLLDCVPHFYHGTRVGAVAPFITVASTKTFIQKMQEIEYYSGFGFYSKVAAMLDGLYVTPGPLSVFKRSALLEIKGFDEDNLTEDMEIALRLHDYGYSLAYSPTQVPTEVPATVRGFYRQRLRWYRGTIFNILKYKKMFFSSRFNEFGKFFFPALTVFVVTTFLSFIVIWGLIFFNIFQVLQIFFLSLLFGQSQLSLSFLGNITVSSLWVFIGLAVLLWYVFFAESISMLSIKKSAQMALPAIATIFLYPLIISFIYTVSLFKELNASKRAWQPLIVICLLV